MAAVCLGDSVVMFGAENLSPPLGIDLLNDFILKLP